MGASANMVLEYLSAHDVPALGSARLPAALFSHVSLAADSAGCDLDGMVLVGSRDELASRGPLLGDTLYVCAECDEAELSPAAGGISKNVILTARCSAPALVELIGSLFAKISEWELKLMDALFDGAGIGRCVELCHEALERPLLILDPDFEMLGSAGVADGGSPLGRLVKSGCGDPQTVFEMILPSRPQATDGLGAPLAEDGKNDAVVHAYAKRSNRALALVLMDCSERPATPAEKDLLDRFASRLAIGLSVCQPKEGRRIKTGDKLEMSVRFLLDGRGTEQETAEMERRVADALEGAGEGCWVFVLEEASGLPPEFLINQVTAAAPGAICLLHEGRLVGVASRAAWDRLGKRPQANGVPSKALASQKHSTYFVREQREDGQPSAVFYQDHPSGGNTFDEYLENAFGVLEPIAQKLGIACGLSSPTVSTRRLDVAYAQAIQALSIGERLYRSWNPFNSFRLAGRGVTAVRSYDELYLHVLCEAFSRSAPLESICHPKLVRIMEYDSENDTDNYRVLYVLLENSMKIGETAKALFMHRNNVRYRVNRIAEQFGLDLDSATERLRLRVSFRALDLLFERESPNRRWSIKPQTAPLPGSASAQTHPIQ